jgi:hypothetical protein
MTEPPVESTFMRNLLITVTLAPCMLGFAVVRAEAPATVVTPAPQQSPSHRAEEMPPSARQHYALVWGVDQLSAKLVESGQLVRFNYRVIDALKAAPLNNRASSPQMLDQHTHAVLQVPTMEKIGPLRQSMAPENGKSYWMVFSNKGNYVKEGHRVSVVIGRFRVDGLIVQPN